MEPPATKIVKNNDRNLIWSVRGNGLCDKQSINVNMDKFWEDQWSSRMEGWASLANPALAMNHFTPRTHHSPSASESSFSVSTRDSPSLSDHSEASPLAGKYALQSPDLSRGRFCKIGLFYPDATHAKSPSMENVSRDFSKVEKEQVGMLLQERGVLESIQHASDLDVCGPLREKLESFVKAKEGLVQSSIGVADEGWLSDGTESWASASSRELSGNHSSNEANDVLSSILYEMPHIRPTNHCHEQGERGWGAKERAGHDAHPGIANQYNDENADISEMQSYAESTDEITSCDNEGYLHESIAVQSRVVNRASAPALASSGQFGMYSLLKPHAWGLETRDFDRYKCLHSRGRANNLNVNMLYNRREGDASCRINAGCLVEGHQEPPVQAGDGRQPFACSLLNVENIALQSQEHDFDGSYLTESGSSTYTESVSHWKQAHVKSRHSAAVEDKYPSSSLHGHFRLVEQDGSQCYSFSVHDSNEVFFARACQPQNENEEVDDCLYTFHSRREEGKTKGGWKTLLKREKSASSLVGKMKVFNAKHMRTDNGYIEETHFVLYGEKSQLPPENEIYKDDQTSDHLDLKLSESVCYNKSKFSKPTLDSHSQELNQRDDSHMSISGTIVSQGIIKSCLHEATSRDDMSRYGLGDIVDVNNACCSNNSIIEQDIPTTQVELAALVITTTTKEYKVTKKKIYESSHKDVAGWGAAFLEKSLKRSSGAGSSSAVGSNVEQATASKEDQQLNAARDMERHRESTDSGERYLKFCSMYSHKFNQKMSRSKREQPKIAVDVEVILPAGHHGLPRHHRNYPAEDGACGPTSLLECWLSGGNCHCGSWDIGCGLSVLKAATLKMHKPRATIALTNSDRINWITPEKPLEIFTQSCKQKRLLMLEIIQAGLFSLSFQARFSPLQAFATAVAIFHEQIAHK